MGKVLCEEQAAAAASSSSRSGARVRKGCSGSEGEAALADGDGLEHAGVRELLDGEPHLELARLFGVVRLDAPGGW
jgi:hypothetical protein